MRDLNLTMVKSDPWYADLSIMRRVLAAFDTLGWLDLLPWARFGDGSPREWAGPPDLARQCQSWGDDTLYLLHEPRSGDNDPQQPFIVRISPWYRKMHLILAFSKGDPVSPDIRLSDLAAFIRTLQLSFGDALVMGPEVCIRLSLDPHPRPWPPRHHNLITSGNLLECFSKRFLRDSDLPRHMMTGILDAEPPFAERVWWLGSDLRAVQWAKDLEDQQMLLETRARQSSYWAKRLDLPVDPNYESLLLNVETGDDPYVSGYHRMGYYHGYQYLTVDPDGGFDLDKVRTLTAWKEAGCLPDGRRLTEVFLIVPTLADALRIYRTVQAMGVKDVFFCTSDACSGNG
jgi:hypothetical protein